MFTFGAMAWTIALLAAPIQFTYPITLYMVPLVAFFGVRALLGPLLYARRVRCSPLETLGAALTAFDIAADGTLSNRRLWASTGSRVPDGIALDANGNIWIANPIAPECALIAPGGKVLDVIDTGAPCQCTRPDSEPVPP